MKLVELTTFGTMSRSCFVVASAHDPGVTKNTTVIVHLKCRFGAWAACPMLGRRIVHLLMLLLAAQRPGWRFVAWLLLGNWRFKLSYSIRRE